MIVTHKLLTQIENVTANTAGFSITTDCQAVFINNTGSDAATLFFNDDDVNGYKMDSGAMLTLDVNSKNEIVGDTIKVVFESTKNPSLKILKQIKTLIQ